MNDPEPRLGREAVERRESLLRELRPIVERRGRRRVAVRLGMTAAATVLVGALGFIAWPAGKRPEQVAVAEHEPKAAPTIHTPEPQPVVQAEPAPMVKIERVRTEPDIVSRLSVRSPVKVQRVGDEDLLAALREAGQEPGLVRIDGRVVVAGNYGR